MVKQIRLGRATGLVALGLFSALALPRSAHAVSLFDDDTNNALASPQTACADTGDLGCNTNWFELADIDQDGDFDIVMANGGALFAPAGAPEEAVLYLKPNRPASPPTVQAAGARFTLSGASKGRRWLSRLLLSARADRDLLLLKNWLSSVRPRRS
jgi:hypothetical protein